MAYFKIGSSRGISPVAIAHSGDPSVAVIFAGRRITVQTAPGAGPLLVLVTPRPDQVWTEEGIVLGPSDQIGSGLQ